MAMGYSMKGINIDSLSIDQLCTLEDEVRETLAVRIAEKKSILEKRLSQLGQATRAVWLAERTLEKIEDPATPPQDRAHRKRKLTKGPSEFREDRIDQPEGIFRRVTFVRRY
jgi:hypothetical protein